MQFQQALKKTSGFTLVELIMAMVLVAIMAAVAVPQFIDYRTEAKNSKAQALLGAIRTGIANQYTQQLLRCGTSAGQWPFADTVGLNDITAGATPRCTTTQVANAAERQFIAEPSIPVNPWGTTNTVTKCLAAGCTPCDASGCDDTTNNGGWCFDETTGAFWAETAANGGGAGAKECNY